MTREIELPTRAYNRDKLRDELLAANAVGYDGLRTAPGKLWLLLADDAPGASETALLAVAAAHDGTTQSSAQQVDAARAVSRDQVVTYIRAQLTNPTPNVAAVKTQVQAYIDTSPKLQTALTNVASLYGYNTGTNAGYLQAALISLSFML